MDEIQSSAVAFDVPAKDTCYVFGNHGFIYASISETRDFTTRHTANLLVSVNGEPLEILVQDGRSIIASAVAIAPKVERRLKSPSRGVVAFLIYPSHMCFRQYSGSMKTDVTPLDRRELAAWNVELERLYAGVASAQEAKHCFNQVVPHIAQMLPKRRCDEEERVSRLLRILREEERWDMNYLSQEFQLSPRRINSLFAQALRMSYLDYKTWCKQKKVLEMIYSDHSLTDIAHAAGFSDSSQFARAFMRWFGQTPSSSRDQARVRLVGWGSRK